MDISWDVQSLRTKIADLPQELVSVLETFDQTHYLESLSRTLIDRRYTDLILVHCERVLAHCCIRASQYGSLVGTLGAYGRILPFAPYLAELVEGFISSRQERLFENSQIKGNEIEYLLALHRLLQFDHHTFSKYVHLPHIERFLDHKNGAVRCVAIRVVARYVYAADAAQRKIYERRIPKDDATGPWEDKQEIHYKYLTLWEEQRRKAIKEALRLNRDARLTASPGHVVLNHEVFDPSTVCIGGVLLPRSSSEQVIARSPAPLVLTSTVDQNLRAFVARLKSPRPILVTGPAGSGKTSLIRHAAASINKLESMVTLHLNEQSDAKTLIGMYTTGTTPGSFNWQAGVLIKAVTEGRWVFIEDIDRAPNEVLSTLLPLIERRELIVPSRDQITRAARGFRIIATIRTFTDFRGNEVTPSLSMLGSRHWRNVQIRSPPASELQDIILGLHPALAENIPTLVKVYDELLQLRQQSMLESRSKTGVMRAINQRDLLKWAARVARLLGGRRSKFSVDDDNIFLDAVDCFAGSLPAGAARDVLTACIAQHLQIDSQRRDHLLDSRVVQQQLEDKFITIGTNRFPRAARRNIPGQSQQTFSTNAHTLRLLERVGSAVAEREPLLLVGETGTGKTTSLQYFANQLGKKVVAFNLSQQSESGDLLGGFKPVNIRLLMIPLKDEFDDLFTRSFSSKVLVKNQPFLDLLNKCMVKGQWLRVCKCWTTALGMVEELRLSALSLGSPSENGQNPHKKRKVERGLDPALKDRWDLFAKEFKNIERRLLSGSESTFAFAFVEGNIVKAVRNGDWVLLDEINLASPDTLEALADLFDKIPSIMLSESGSVDRIEAHPEFRVFAAMNPATDVGKKDLPLGIRSRFTELYVESPDRDLQSLQQIVQAYLGKNETAMATAASRLHQAILDLASKELLVDGAGQKPHFSLRTLTRALAYVRDMLPHCSLRRALYEGFQMSYLTLLDLESEARVVPLIQQHLYGKQTKQMSELKQPMRLENASGFIQEGRYWLKQGSFPVEEQSHYIITDFVRKNLDNLIRASSTRRFPILLQGPTSSGKTSMVEYLAKRSGNKFVRINNHEHTDLQEYLGSYISGSDGKLVFQEGVLVKALREGHWVVLDELNLAPTDVLEALNRLLDDNRELFIPETQETVRPHENFMLFATQNPAGLYGGRKVLSRAFRNRFLELHFDDIPIDELHIILQKRTQIPNSWAQRIVSVYKELAVLRQENRMFESKSFATLRDLFRWALRPSDTIEQLGVHGFMILAERVRKSNERAEVKRVIEKVLSQRGPKVVINEEELYSQAALGLSDETTKALESQGVVWTNAMRRLYVLTLAAIKNNEPVLLVGETGCGKTTVCQMLAAAYSKQLFIVNAHQNTETGDLIGAQRPARNRAVHEQTLVKLLMQSQHELVLSALDHGGLDEALKVYDQLQKSQPDGIDETSVDIAEARARLKILFEWADGSLIQAMKSGQFFLLDEISLADDSVLERLNSVLEPQRSILLAEKGSLESFVAADEGYQFFATMNPGGDYGKKELSPALRNRFTEIWVPSLSDAEDVSQVIRSKLINPELTSPMMGFAQWFQQRYDRTASNSISIRDLLAWVEFVNRAPDDPVVQVVHGAAMVYVDSLGANPAAMLAINSAQIAAERQACLAKLGQLLNVDAKAIYSAPVTFDVAGPHLRIGNFRLPKIEDVVEDSNFTLQAPRTRENAMRIARALQLVKPVLIEGNPGVGKTSLVTAIANLTGTPLTRINLSEQTDLMDLFGSDVPVEGAEAGTFAWRDAPYLRAMKNGEWVLLDEMNLASQSVLEGLNACLDHRGEVYISELDQTFRRHPDFRLFAAQNPHHQGGGRKGLPASFVNRFTVVYADVFQQEDLISICGSAFPNLTIDQIEPVVNFMDQLDQAITDRRLGTVGGPWEFNLRDTLRWLSLTAAEDGLLRSGGPFDFLPILITQRFRTEKDRSLAFSLFKSIFQDVHHAHDLFHNVSEAFVQVGMGLLPRDQLISPTLSPSSERFDMKLHLPVMESLMISVQKNWPVILVGPSGCGKTMLLEQLAALAGNKLVTFPLNADIDSMDLVGGYEQSDPQRRLNKFAKNLRDLARSLQITNMTDTTSSSIDVAVLKSILDVNTSPQSIVSSKVLVWLRNAATFNGDAENLAAELLAILSAPAAIDRAQFEWTDGALVQAIQNGEWLILDNANLCSPAALDRLNSLLEPNGLLIINEHTNAAGEPNIIKPHPNFRIFLTMDPRYGELSRALRNRAVEICMLNFDEPTSQIDQSDALVLGSESELHRLRNIKYLSESDSTQSIDVAHVAIDHLSEDELAHVKSFRRQLEAGLYGVPLEVVGNALSAARQSTLLMMKDRPVPDEVPSDMLRLQTAHPLNNMKLLSTLSASLSVPSMQAFAYEMTIELSLMKSTLTLAQEKRGPKALLTRLERSANARRIPDVARDSTAGVFNSLSSLNDVLDHAASTSRMASDGELSDGHSRALIELSKSFKRYWWDLCELTNGSNFDEAAFQVYKEIGRELLSSVQFGEISSPFAACLDSMGPADQLANAATMTMLWTAYRPQIPKMISQLDVVLELERLADQFDTVAWSFESPIEQLLDIRRAFSEAIQLARSSSNGESLLQSLKSVMAELPADLENSVVPHFQKEFEIICQRLDLRQAVATAVEGADVSKLPAASLLALRKTRALASSTGTKASHLDLLNQIAFTDVSGVSPSKTGNFVTTAVSAVGSSDDVPISRLGLLKRETETLGSLLARTAHLLDADPTNSLASLLEQMLQDLLGLVHQSSSGSTVGQTCGALLGSFQQGIKSVPNLGKEAGSDKLSIVVMNTLWPCLRILLDIRVSGSGSAASKLALLANAWTHFALGCILLYTPSQAYDPALKPIIQRTMFRRRRQELSDKLNALQTFEQKFTGQSSTLRIRLVEEELIQIGEEPAVLELARPVKSQSSELQGIFNAVLRTMQPLADLAEGSIHTKATDMVLRSNISQLKRRLDDDYRAYDDMTAPLVGFLGCLEIGLSLGAVSQQQAAQSSLSVTVMTPMLGCLPIYWTQPVKGVSPTSESLEVQLHYLRALAVLQPYGFVDPAHWLQADEVFDATYNRWKVELQSKQDETATKSSLYTYRGGDDVEDEDMDEDYKTLFPDFEGDEASQEQASQEQRPLSQTVNNFAARFADALEAVTEPTTKDDGVLSLMDHVSGLSRYIPSENSQLFPLLLKNLHTKRQQISTVTTAAVNYNIYTDPNMGEVQRLMELVSKTKIRFLQIQAIWPEHATLGEVLRTCQELLAFRHNDPLAKIITKLEKLHEYVHQWQLVASSEFSAVTIYDSVTDLIVRWRQIELSTWSRMLDMEVARCNEDAKSWFFIAYESIVAAPLSMGGSDEQMREHTVELLKTLHDFFRSTGAGQYHQRLRMLGSLQKYVKTRARSVPALLIVSNALANLISYLRRFEQPVQQAIITGRSKLEKNMKNVIQMASWRDRTIDSLKQSAKASHRKLFRIIRKFRSLLGQPVQGILQAGVSDSTSSTTVIAAPSTHMVDWYNDRQKCEQAYPSWDQLPARFKNVQTTLTVMMKMTSPMDLALSGSEEVNVWLQDVENLAAQLKKATPTIFNEDNKEAVQHLKVRKRTLFADVLKELRMMGFKSNLSGDAIAKQESMELILSTLPPLAADVESAGLSTAELYLHQVLQNMPQVRTAAREHSDDLTGAEIARSIALLESMLQNVMQQRQTIMMAQKSALTFKDSLAKMKHLSAAQDIQFLHRLPPTGYGLVAATSTLPVVLRTTVHVLEAQISLGDLGEIAATKQIVDHASRISALDKEILSIQSLPNNLTTSKAQEVLATAAQEIIDLQETLRKTIEVHPYFQPTLAQTMYWSTFEQNEAAQVHSEDVDLQSFLQNACSVVDVILGSFEDLQKILQTLPQTSDDSQWLVQEATILGSAIRCLRMNQVSAAITDLLDSLQFLATNPENLKLALALTSTFGSFINRYNDAHESVCNRLAELHQSTCRATAHLSQTFIRLAKDGFCTPPDKNAGKQEGDEKLEGGTGLGDGDGGEDISKDIEADEDLTELAQEKAEGDDDKDEIEDEKDAVDMADADMEGQMGDAEEKEEDGEGDEGSEKDDDEMEEEAGDVDDLGPNTVDEKMWDDGGKDDADKDQETDKADGAVDQDELAAAEGKEKEEKEKEKADGEKEEGGDDAPEEEVGAEEDENAAPQEAEKADPHVQEQENLDLPDDINIDGEDVEDREDSEMGDLGDDMMDEKDAGPDDVAEDSAEGEVDDHDDMADTSEKGEEDQDPETEGPAENEDDLEDKTQEAGEDAEEEEAASDENVLQDQRQDDSKAADDVAPSEAQGTGLSEPQQQEQQAKQDAGSAEQQQGAEGATQEQQQAAGAQGQRGDAQEQPEAGEDQNQDEETQPFKKLGDALEKWYKQNRQIADAQEREAEQKQTEDADMADAEFEHLPDESADADAQALGAATEEQATAIDEDAGLPTNDQETQDYFPPEERDAQNEETADVDMADADMTERDQPPPESAEGQANAFVGEYKERPLEPEPSRAETREEDDEMEDIDNKSDVPIQALQDDSDSVIDMDQARQVWSTHESSTRTLALTLTEHLRLILAPTQATKMRGDFRTGKRLNIKRIIPYIASQYKRDKIWMRRSVPSKRAYQIMLAVDDSKSMGESGSSSLAFDTLALVSRALTMLEAGDLAIVGFGSDVSIAHDFGTPFSSDSGAEVVRSLQFNQNTTDIRRLLERSLDLFAQARMRSASSSSAELWQLQLIISDGVCKDHGEIRRLVRRAAEERIMIVFVIVDAAATSNKAGTGGSSILDLQTANFGKDENGNLKVETVKYLETFPFRYYLVVRDVEELPTVLASALRQWFAEVVDSA